jgi:hypothetical protein
MSDYRKDPSINLQKNTRNDRISFTNNGNNQRDGTTLATDEKPAWTRDKATHTCWQCNQKGHHAYECDNERQSATTNVMDGTITNTRAPNESDNDGYQFSQIEAHSIPNTWILLNNQSTINVFQNKEMLNNICKSESRIDIHCNDGIASTNIIGDLSGYGTVWYPHGIASILSLAKMTEKGYQVSYYSKSGNAFTVSKPEEGSHIFQQSDCGLYYIDTKASSNSNLFITIVADNISSYTKCDYLKASLA